MPSLLRRCRAALRAPVNEVAFALRSALAWSRGDAVLPREDPAGLYAWLPADARAAARQHADELGRRHDLAALAARSTCAVFAHNLDLLDRLEALTRGVAPPDAGDGPLRALDVGSGDFHYATALQRFLAGPCSAGRPVELVGVELDGHGIYRDGHSRADHARAHAALAGPGVSFVVGDVARLALPPQHVVTLLFPFVSAYPLLQWGLPLSRFRPRRLLRAAVAALRPGGWLVVANQTEAEFARLGALLADQPVERVRRGSFASGTVPDAARTAARIGSLWRRLGPAIDTAVR